MKRTRAQRQRDEDSVEETPPSPMRSPMRTRSMRRRAQARLRRDARALAEAADARRASNILCSELESEDRNTITRLLRTDYPTVLKRDVHEDPWPLVLDERGTLRWKEDPMVAQLATSHYNQFVPGSHMDPARARLVNSMTPLDLDKLAFAVQAGHYPPHLFRRLMKRLGYSLQGYYELDPWQEREQEEDEEEEIVVL